MGTASTVQMVIRDGSNSVIPGIDTSKFVITVTGGTMQGTAVNGTVEDKGSGSYEFVINNTGSVGSVATDGTAIYTVVVDGVNIGTATHIITPL